MNAERLLALYERIADATDAVDQLRHFILESAMRGNLVPQDSKDLQVPDLDSDLPKSFVPPFQIPSNWRWVRLQKLGKLKGGGTPSKARDDFWTGGIPWVSPKDMKRDYIAEAQLNISDEAVANSAVSLIEPGSILFVVRGMILAHSFPVALTRASLTVNQDIKALSLKYPEMGEFLLRALKGIKTEMLKRVQRSSHGTCRLERPDYCDFPIPLPPLPEQHRIVTKVDELMGLCDRLEAARSRCEVVRDRLAAVSLSRLDVPDPKTFQADTRFALDYLPSLTAHSKQIKALRQTILNLAVRGKLVPQDPSDESAAELLARMAKTRESIVARRNIKGALTPKLSSPEFEVFSLPTSWELCPLGQITLVTDPNPSHRYPDYSGGTVPMLSTREFAGDDGWNPETAKLTTQAFWEFQKGICDFAEGDIVFARKGRLGLPRFLPPFEKFTFSHTLFSIKPIAGLYPAYLLYLLRRDEVVIWLTNEMNQNTGVPTLGKAKIEQLPISLPPLAEQHRIVAKVDALMSLCDRFEAALIAADSARARLLDALLAEALAPTADSSGVTMVEPTAAAALPRIAVTTERSALVLSLAYERHCSARRDRTFGHVKAEKILHLVEAEAGLELGRAPIRDAAGPNDFGHLLGVDRWAKQHRRFAFDRRGKGYTFERLADFQDSLESVNTIDAPTRARVEKIIDLFVPMDTEAAELFATLYAAWNNLLLEGKSPDDADILRAAREDWHPDKLKIPLDRFAAALRHLKASEFVPSGQGKFVPPAPQRDLFLSQ